MRRTTRIWTTLCFFLAVASVPVSAQDSPWKATINVEPTEALLGSVVYVTLEITNTSNEPVVVSGTFTRCSCHCGLGIGAPSSDTQEPCVRISECSPDYPLERYLSKRAIQPGEVLISRLERFQPRCAGSYTIMFSCDVPLSVTEPEVNTKTGEPVSNNEVWHGSFSSNEVTFQAIEPQGLDAEVYEEFLHNPIDGLQSDRERLLRTFPTSTYAAELVYRMSWPGMRPYSLNEAVSSMQAKARGFPPTGLPCSEPIASRCRRVGGRPSGTEAARRNVAWIDFVLQYHPTIRFADQLRFMRAHAAYFLGEEADCVSRLESLAKTARPEVAARARDLLEAMKAKGLVGPPPDDQGAEQ